MQLPAYEKLKDIPSLMQARPYGAFYSARSDVHPPVTWKLKDRRPISLSAPPFGRPLYHAVLLFL